MTKRFQVPAIGSSEITPESVWLNRRSLMKAGGALAGLGFAGVAPVASAVETGGVSLDFASASAGHRNGFFTDEKQTPLSDATSFCNFYEFGTDKDDPPAYAHEMSVDPWSIEVEGEVARPGRLNLEDIIGGFDLEERVYRFRCVEAWSMVVPWIGFELGQLLKRFEPTARAKYVAFETLYDRKQMRGTRSFTAAIDWPYREGLRIDEAMNPLTILSVGMYGKTLPNQNGAPVRLVVPWKYGFKSIKSIVKIRLTESQPRTSWQALAPREYGFYANVNPEVDHPRWSQANERRLPSTIFNPNRRPTLKFNGYSDQVAGLYEGMDLATSY